MKKADTSKKAANADYNIIAGISQMKCTVVAGSRKGIIEYMKLNKSDSIAIVNCCKMTKAEGNRYNKEVKNWKACFNHMLYS